MADAGPTVDLVNRYQNGDENARDPLCDRLLPHVKKAIELYLEKKIKPNWRRRLEVDDFVSVSVMRCLRTIDTTNTKSDGAFIYKCVNQIVKTNIIDEIRKMLAEKRGGGEEIISFPSVGEVDFGQLTPSEDAMNREREEHFLELMDELKEKSPDQWELIKNHNFCHLTFEEMAHEMDKTYDAVRMQYSRARKALRNAFAEKYGEEAQ